MKFFTPVVDCADAVDGMHTQSIGFIFMSAASAAALTGAAASWFSVLDFDTAMGFAAAIFAAGLIGTCCIRRRAPGGAKRQDVVRALVRAEWLRLLSRK